MMKGDSQDDSYVSGIQGNQYRPEQVKRLQKRLQKSETESLFKGSDLFVIWDWIIVKKKLLTQKN